MPVLGVGSKFRTEVVALSSTSKTTVYTVHTCPPNHDATVDFLHVSNGNTATQNVTVQWYHADTNTYHHIVNDKAIAGKDVYNIITADRMHLHAGDKISAFNGGSGNLEMFISVRQYYNPARV